MGPGSQRLEISRRCFLPPDFDGDGMTSLERNEQDRAAELVRMFPRMDARNAEARSMVYMELLGRIASQPGSRPADQDSVPCLGGSRFDPLRDEKVMLAELSFEECPDCAGTGADDDGHNCINCEGEGVIAVWEGLE